MNPPSTRGTLVARELRALVALTALLGLGAGTSLVQSVRTTRPQAVYVTSDGRAYVAEELYRGAPLAGNRPGDLEAARVAATSLARTQFNVTPGTLTAQVRAVDGQGTAHGRAVYRRWLPRELLATLVLADSGTIRVREYGTGASAAGEAPGRVKVTVPLTGWLYSRHVPFAGPYSGIPLRGDTQWWMERDVQGAWRLDSVAGTLLDSGVVESWTLYHVASRSLPAVVIAHEVVARDSAAWAAWRMPKPYGRF